MSYCLTIGTASIVTPLTEERITATIRGVAALVVSQACPESLSEFSDFIDGENQTEDFVFGYINDTIRVTPTSGGNLVTLQMCTEGAWFDDEMLEHLASELRGETVEVVSASQDSREGIFTDSYTLTAASVPVG